MDATFASDYFSVKNYLKVNNVESSNLDRLGSLH